MQVPRNGDLSFSSLPKVLMSLKSEKATGTLAIQTSDFTKNIYVREGSPVFASSTLSDDRLGEMLLKAGKITVDQYRESADLIKTTGRRQGSILVELGHITPRDLTWAVRHQVSEIIYSLFRLESAAYEFRDGYLPSNEVITLNIGMERVVYQGIKRLSRAAWIDKEMSDTEMVVVPDSSYAGAREGSLAGVLGDDEAQLISLIDGERSLGEVIRESSLSEHEAKKSLFILISLGVARLWKRRAKPKHADAKTASQGRQERTERAEKPEEVSREFMDRAEGLFQGLETMRPHEILEVTGDSDAQEIRRNYYRLAKEFHPDRFHLSGDAAMKRKMTTIFDAVTKAYRLLQDDTKRREYFDSLGESVRRTVQEEPGEPQLSPEEQKLVLLKEQFQRGIQEFKEGDYWGTVQTFRWVTREDPKNPKGWSYLSLALTKIPNRLKEAEEALHHAIRLEPFNSEHITNMGLIYLKAGLNARAKGQFEKALKLDPNNTRAKKGLEEAG